MRPNNVNVEGMMAFVEQAKLDPGVLKKQKRVEGIWSLDEGQSCSLGGRLVLHCRLAQGRTRDRAGITQAFRHWPAQPAQSAMA
jgi:hypothetical protein